MYPETFTKQRHSYSHNRDAFWKVWHKRCCPKFIRYNVPKILYTYSSICRAQFLSRLCTGIMVDWLSMEKGFKASLHKLKDNNAHIYKAARGAICSEESHQLHCMLVDSNNHTAMTPEQFMWQQRANQPHLSIPYQTKSRSGVLARAMINTNWFLTPELLNYLLAGNVTTAICWAGPAAY